MRECSRSSKLIVLLFPAVCACLGGCAKKIWITQYPEFWRQEMANMRIAVVPFRNRTRRRYAGDALSDELAYALSANAQATGSYRSVLNRNDIGVLMDQRDLQLALGGSNATLAEQFRRLPGIDVQAILVGTVTTYDATTRNERRREPQRIYDKKGNVVRVVYREYVHTRNEATVAAAAALIRVRDGATIYATPAPAQCQQPAEGSPPKMDRNACLTVARRDVVAQLVRHFAVTRQQIEVQPGKDFRTGSEVYDNKWTWTDKFSVAADKAYVVLRLPAVCDRNRFRITIVRENQREDLVSVERAWRREWGSKGFEFSPMEVARKGGGPGKYVAKFYCGPEPVLTHKFEIVAPR